MPKQALATFKGVKDYIGASGKLFEFVTGRLARVIEGENYAPCYCSLIDPVEIYTSSLGSSSDIIQKEMFYLKKDDLVLRPEGTANLLYAVIKNNLHRSAKFPLKQYYLGPMFRYERPQLGRYRQFWHIGVEILDVKENLSQDLDLLLLASGLVDCLQLQDKVTLHINNIGDNKVREAYNGYIKSYFEDRPSLLGSLSAESRARLDKNPLRILDSKNPQDQEPVSGLKPFRDFLSPESRQNFEAIQSALTALRIPFQVNPRLVRGLDYYNDLCFEYICQDKISNAQNAVIAGGRYDKLYQKIPIKAGMPIFGTGFAVGIDRIIDIFQNDLERLCRASSGRSETLGVIAIVAHESDFASIQKHSHEAIGLVRQAVPEVKIDKLACPSSQITKRFQYLAEKGIVHCLIIGEDEAKSGYVTLRNLQQFEQRNIPMQNLAQEARALIGGL